MLIVNTPLTLLFASLTLASEGLHFSTIRCLQALGEKDMVPALYFIPWPYVGNQCILSQR